MLGEVSIIEMVDSKRYSRDEIKKQAKVMVHQLVYQDIGFCSCGKAEDILILIKKVLKAIDDKTAKRLQEHSSYSLDRIIDEYKEEMDKLIPQKLIQELMLQILTSYGLIDHKKIIHNSFLTPYGEEILCALNILYKNK